MTCRRVKTASRGPVDLIRRKSLKLIFPVEFSATVFPGRAYQCSVDVSIKELMSCDGSVKIDVHYQG